MMNFLSLFFLIFSFILPENCNSKTENTKSTINNYKKSNKITLNNDTKISANFIEINRKIGSIILTGNVVVDDGESSLLSEKMTIIFEKKTAENKNGKIKKIFSDKKIKIFNQETTAIGDSGYYDPINSIFVLENNVNVNNGISVASGEKFIYNLITKKGDLIGGNALKANNNNSSKPNKTNNDRVTVIIGETIKDDIKK
jgi:lipopolysaccharide transport protein LptA